MHTWVYTLLHSNMWKFSIFLSIYAFPPTPTHMPYITTSCHIIVINMKRNLGRYGGPQLDLYRNGRGRGGGGRWRRALMVSQDQALCFNSLIRLLDWKVIWSLCRPDPVGEPNLVAWTGTARLRHPTMWSVAEAAWPQSSQGAWPSPNPPSWQGAWGMTQPQSSPMEGGSMVKPHRRKGACLAST